ncbi:hypothetical protein SLA2020_438720 [Shorea laevis]
MLVDEQVALFLYIIAHHSFLRNRRQLQKTLQMKWRWFKNCLGALDGTHIRVRVPLDDKPRYRNRKGEITTNVLGVCSQNMQFIYVLAGWEGSAADGRVLRDAINRRNGLRVPHGYYYLVDAGYTNCKGFLAPYRGQRYHLNDWRVGHQPTTAEEFFNMKHSELPVDPLEEEMDQQDQQDLTHTGTNNDPITQIEASDEWSAWRTTMANEMFNSWRGIRRGN